MPTDTGQQIGRTHAGRSPAWDGRDLAWIQALPFLIEVLSDRGVLYVYYDPDSTQSMERR